MPDDVVSCIGKHLEDYPFEIYKDTELYKMFFKHDKPDDYKEYIKYISDIKNYKTYKEYDFTESCKTDINVLLLNIKKYYKELKIKTYEIKFKHQKYTEKGCEDEIRISPKIYFYNKDKFNCLCISIIDVKNRPFIKIPFNDIEVEKINKIFEELIKDFKLYTKRCVAFNCNYNNEFDLKLKKYLKQNKTKIIKIDDKPKQVNLTTEIDDKIREREELMDEKQIINGKTIEFGTFINTDIVVPLNTKEDIKDYIFRYINRDFQDIEKYAKKRKVKLINDDIWKCFFILFKRCKILLDINKGYYNKDVYNMDDDEEKDIFEEYLKVNKLNSPQKFEY